MTWLSIEENENRAIMINFNKVKKIVIQKGWYDPVLRRKRTKIVFVGNEPIASIILDTDNPEELIAEILKAVEKGNAVVKITKDGKIKS